MSNVSESFHADGNITAIIRYVRSNGVITLGPGVSFLGTFTGKLINCQLDCRGKSASVINNVGDNAIIERCKLLSDSAYTTINATSSVSAQIAYTITNYGISGNITNILSTNYNRDFPTAI